MKMVVFTTALIGLVGPALSMTSAQTDIKQFEWTTNLTFLAEEGHADALPRELHRTQINPIQKLLRRVKRAVEKRRPAAAARRAAPASGSDNTVKPKALELKAKVCRDGHKHCESLLTDFLEVEVTKADGGKEKRKLKNFEALATYLTNDAALGDLAAFPLTSLFGIDGECCKSDAHKDCAQKKFAEWVTTIKKDSHAESVNSGAWNDPAVKGSDGLMDGGTGDEAFTAWRDYAFCSACIRDVEGKKDDICGRIGELSETMYVYRGLVESLQKETKKEEKEKEEKEKKEEEKKEKEKKEKE